MLVLTHIGVQYYLKRYQTFCPISNVFTNLISCKLLVFYVLTLAHGLEQFWKLLLDGYCASKECNCSKTK